MKSLFLDQPATKLASKHAFSHPANDQPASNQPIGQKTSKPDRKWVGPPANQAASQRAKQPVSQSVSQPASQPASQR